MIKKIMSTGFCVLILALVTTAQMKTVEQTLKLGLTDVKVRIHTNKLLNKPINKTFVVVHHNEQKGLAAAKEVIAKPTEGGRLVEIVSVSNNNKPQRFLHFDFGDQKNLCVDPNRMYAVKGIIDFFKNGYKDAIKTENCKEINLTDFDSETDESIKEIFRFGKEILKIVTLNNTHRFIVGVHNNGDTSLSVESWSNGRSESKTAMGIFLANSKTDNTITPKGNFILVSNVNLFSKILSFGEDFNLALQKDGSLLSNIDDGSMSIYFGKKLINYINIEAEGREDKDDDAKRKQLKAISLVNQRL